MKPILLALCLVLAGCGTIGGLTPAMRIMALCDSYSATLTALAVARNRISASQVQIVNDVVAAVGPVCEGPLPAGELAALVAIESNLARVILIRRGLL